MNRMTAPTTIFASLPITTTTIEHLYHEHHQPLLRYLYRLVSDREAAEDLCHETFINVLRHWHTLNAATAAKGWLLVLTRFRGHLILRVDRRFMIGRHTAMCTPRSSSARRSSRHGAGPQPRPGGARSGRQRRYGRALGAGSGATVCGSTSRGAGTQRG